TLLARPGAGLLAPGPDDYCDFFGNGFFNSPMSPSSATGSGGFCSGLLADTGAGAVSWAGAFAGALAAPRGDLAPFASAGGAPDASPTAGVGSTGAGLDGVG